MNKHLEAGLEAFGIYDTVHGIPQRPIKIERISRLINVGSLFHRFACNMYDALPVIIYHQSISVTVGIFVDNRVKPAGLTLLVFNFADSETD